MHRHPEHNDEIDRAFDETLALALVEYKQKQEQLDKTLSGIKKWHYDLKTCTIKFGGLLFRGQSFNITPIATLLPSSMNWCWVWINDSFPALAREKSSRIKALAARTQYKIFLSAHFDVTFEEIDELCALALMEVGGSGVFKVKDQEPWLFLIIE